MKSGSAKRLNSNRERRFAISTVLAAPLFLLTMGTMLFGHAAAAWIPPRTLAWIELALATPVVLWGGWPFFERMWASLRSRNLNMFTLIGIGTGTAYIHSTIATFFPQVFPHSFRSSHGGIDLYFESAAVITTLVLLGQVLDNLVDNAFKYSEPGKPVTVSVALTRDGGGLTVTVADEGAGVAGEEAERVFEPFYRGSADRWQGKPGVGLGLAVARRLVAILGDDPAYRRQDLLHGGFLRGVTHCQKPRRLARTGRYRV